MAGGCITILGIFVADLAFMAKRLPVMGETILGEGFRMGPGGKGSNQAVAAGRAGGAVTFITKVGEDSFGEIGVATWAKDGVDTSRVLRTKEHPTGAAFIFVSTESGNNAIIVESGAAGTLSVADIEANADAIRASKVFVTQFEQPLDVAWKALDIARSAGVTTILNPAPARTCDPAMLASCDYLTPNETEAASLTGVAVESVDDARRAGDAFLRLGVGAALITLGDKGALLHSGTASTLIPAFAVGRVVDTTGAGDAFNGGFAVALAEGRSPIEAARFGCATAGISVTRHGTAPSMPTRAEIDELMRRG
jgi:ribokinase